MNVSLSLPSKQMLIAAGRHAVSYTAGAVTGVAGLLLFATATHIISADQSSQITSGLTNVASGTKAIVDGIGTLAGGIMTLLSVASGIWAAFSASSSSQAASIISNHPGTTIITDPALAAKVPSDSVVSNTTTVAVPK
jgi:X-X-X-Leu-X-X-Gly heptad repeat protein